MKEHLKKTLELGKHTIFGRDQIHEKRNCECWSIFHVPPSPGKIFLQKEHYLKFWGQGSFIVEEWQIHQQCFQTSWNEIVEDSDVEHACRRHTSDWTISGSRWTQTRCSGLRLPFFLYNLIILLTPAPITSICDCSLTGKEIRIDVWYRR